MHVVVVRSVDEVVLQSDQIDKVEEAEEVAVELRARIVERSLAARTHRAAEREHFICRTTNSDKSL